MGQSGIIVLATGGFLALVSWIAGRRPGVDMNHVGFSWRAMYPVGFVLYIAGIALMAVGIVLVSASRS
jgi:hypothetical protein